MKTKSERTRIPAAKLLYVLHRRTTYGFYLVLVAGGTVFAFSSFNHVRHISCSHGNPLSHNFPSAK